MRSPRLEVDTLAGDRLHTSWHLNPSSEMRGKPHLEGTGRPTRNLSGQETLPRLQSYTSSPSMPQFPGCRMGNVAPGWRRWRESWCRGAWEQRAWAPKPSSLSQTEVSGPPEAQTAWHHFAEPRCLRQCSPAVQHCLPGSPLARSPPTPGPWGTAHAGPLPHPPSSPPPPGSLPCASLVWNKPAGGAAQPWGLGCRPRRRRASPEDPRSDIRPLRGSPGPQPPPPQSRAPAGCPSFMATCGTSRNHRKQPDGKRRDATVPASPASGEGTGAPGLPRPLPAALSGARAPCLVRRAGPGQVLPGALKIFR